MKLKLREQLLSICWGYEIPKDEYLLYGRKPTEYDLIPYAPYIPNKWNRILVIAESQQQSGKNLRGKEYIKKLSRACIDDLIFRLGNEEITGKKPDVQLGVTPWDEGYLKLAMLSCFPEYKTSEYALSNAIPWYLDNGNSEQVYFLTELSIEFWTEILEVLKPKIIICSSLGRFADYIISETCYCDDKQCDKFDLCAAPFPEEVVHLFEESDLLERYPEVKNAIELNPNIVEKSGLDKRFYISYAAHAVSKIKPVSDKSK